MDEKNGVVLAFYAPDDRAPEYVIPAIPEYGTEHFASWSRRTMRIRTKPREVVENVVDLAHFPFVHENRIDTFENEFVGERAIQRATGGGIPDGKHVGVEYDYASTATYFGPGYQITEMQHRIDTILLNAHTMIDEHELELRFGVMMRMTGDPAKRARIAERYAEDLLVGFQKDVAIWEHKKWRDAPVLVAEDGPIGELRKWYAQFYVPEPAA